MKRAKSLLALLGLLLLIPASARAQQWSGIIDPSRAIDWSISGVPGGIPTRTVCTTVNASTFGNGASDATAGIQAALNACPANQAVSLSAGTFRINSSVRVPGNVTLRGAGPQSTILDARGSSNAVVSMGGGTPSASASVNITAGATAGSSSITLSSASGITVGSYLMITELNDPSYVTISTPNGDCGWCDYSMWGGTRVRGQIVEVTSVSGTAIGISPSLYSAYSRTPLATRFTASAKYAGVENLQVFANNTGYTTNFSMDQCAYCWVRNVEGNYADGDHVQVAFSYRCEIRDSYFSNAFIHGPGSTDADIFIVGKSSGVLVENNILERLHTSIMLNWGAAGNVLAYNYSIGSFDSGATNAVMIDFAVHGAHPQFNLWEGNVGPTLFPDSFWGSGSHNTAYRNWWRGTTLIAPFSDGSYTGRKTVNWAGAHLASQQNRGISLNYTHTRYNLIGNISGSADAAKVASLFNSAPGPCTSCLVAPGNRNYDGTFYAFNFGYHTGGDSSGGSVPSQWVSLAYSTAFIHGNYDTASKSTFWDIGGTASHTLPASAYRSSKPSWFGNTPWPPIGPDVTGGIDAGGRVYPNPAQVCYESTPKLPTGLLAFDAANCYGQLPRPAPPTNLSILVQ